MALVEKLTLHSIQHGPCRAVASIPI
jgi:hypothetical protein